MVDRVNDYHDGNRSLQDRFDTRRIADRIASRTRDHLLLPAYPGAQCIVCVEVTEVYGNCPRYIHKYQQVERSAYVPKAGSEPPIPEWKLRADINPILPANDPARKSV